MPKPTQTHSPGSVRPRGFWVQHQHNEKGKKVMHRNTYYPETFEEKYPEDQYPDEGPMPSDWLIGPEPETTVTTCKQTARGIRIWLEGTKLTGAGFAPDMPYTATYDADAKCITLRVDSTSKKRVTKSSRNGQPRPIIDLMNKSVASVFSGGTQVRATFGTNLITIREA